MDNRVVVFKQILKGYSLEWDISQPDENSVSIKMEPDDKQNASDEQSTFTFSIPKTARFKIIVSAEECADELPEDFEMCLKDNNTVHTEFAEEEEGEY